MRKKKVAEAQLKVELRDILEHMDQHIADLKFHRNNVQKLLEDLTKEK